MFYHFTVVLILLSGSMVFAQMFRGRVRDKLTPVIFALIIFAQAARIATHNPIFVYFALFMTSVGVSFLSNGYALSDMRRNPVLVAFLLFWFYLLLSTFWGDCTLISFLTFCHVLLGPIAAGYFTGMWAIKDERRWQRLCVFLLVTTLLICVAYAYKGIFLGDMNGVGDQQVQAGFGGDMATSEDGGANVNAIGLMAAGLLSMPIVSLFMSFHTIRFLRNKEWMVKGIGGGLALILALIIVRTGSRNSALAFFPVLCYGLFSHTGLGVVKKWFLIGCLVVAAIFLVGRHISKGTELRMFKYVSDTTTVWDDGFGGNRLGMFRDRLYGLKAGKYFWGNGALISYPRREIGNGHSVYFQVFYQSGFLGMFLMMIFFGLISIKMFSRNRMKGIAALMFGIWAITGLGESQNILLGGVSKYFLGMGIAFCTNLKFRQPWLPFNR